MYLKKSSVIYFFVFFIYSGQHALNLIVISFGLGSFQNIIAYLLKGFQIYLVVILLKKERIQKLSIESFILISFIVLFIIKILALHNLGFKFSKPLLSYIFYLFSYCLIPFVFFKNLSFFQNKNTVINALIDSGLIFGFSTLIFYGKYLLMDIGRISDAVYVTGEETMNPLLLGYAAVLTISVSFFSLMHIKKLSVSIHKVVLSIIISVPMFFLSSSRGSLISLSLVCIIMLLHYRKKIKFKSLIFVGLTFTAVTIYYLKSSSNLIERLSSPFNENSSVKRILRVDRSRENLWSLGMNEFYNNPIFGGQFEFFGIYPHNLFIEILCSTGIIGFLLYSSLLVKSTFNLISLSKKTNLSIFIVIIFFQAIVLHFFSSSVYYSVLLSFGLGMALSEKNKNYI